MASDVQKQCKRYEFYGKNKIFRVKFQCLSLCCVLASGCQFFSKRCVLLQRVLVYLRPRRIVLDLLDPRIRLKKGQGGAVFELGQAFCAVLVNVTDL